MSLEPEDALVSSCRKVVAVFLVVERDRAEVLAAILFYLDAFTSFDLRSETNGVVVDETVEFIEFAKGSLSRVAGCCDDGCYCCYEDGSVFLIRDCYFPEDFYG